jgi:hypothetical protein
MGTSNLGIIKLNSRKKFSELKRKDFILKGPTGSIKGDSSFGKTEKFLNCFLMI